MKRKKGCSSFLLLLLATVLIIFLVRLGKEPPKQENVDSYFMNLPKNQYDPQLFYEENGFVKYENAMVGVDVSAHQKQIDWQAVKNAGVDFAIIRVAYRGYTNGSISADPYFVTNINGAKEAGLQVGVYLFSQAVSVSEAEEEAHFVLSCLDGMSLDLPVYFDWETVGAESRTNECTGSDVTNFTLAFCHIVEDAGYDAGVYFNESMGYMFFRLPDLQNYEFWLAQYKSKPDFYYDFTTWQYSAEGEVDGIGVPVDLNLRFMK